MNYCPQVHPVYSRRLVGGRCTVAKCDERCRSRICAGNPTILCTAVLTVGADRALACRQNRRKRSPPPAAWATAKGPTATAFSTAKECLSARYGIVWNGMVRYRTVWNGMVWYGMHVLASILSPLATRTENHVLVITTTLDYLFVAAVYLYRLCPHISPTDDRLVSTHDVD